MLTTSSHHSPKAQAMMSVWSQETLSLDFLMEDADMQVSCFCVISFSSLMGGYSLVENE